MKIGKLRPDLLEKYVLNRVGFIDHRVIIGGRVGEDAALIDLGDEKVLVVHTDPITGSIDLLGILGILVPSNDIVVRGVKPSWASVTIFLTPNTEEREIDRITKQLHETAEKLEIMIIGGHTEYTDAVKRPVVVTTMIGVGDLGKIVTTSGARVGDLIILTKTIGIEATAIIAREFRDLLERKGVSKNIIERATRYYEKISVMKEALLLSSRKYVNAMHDPTEGGVLAGLAELAYASNKSIIVYKESLPLSEETKILSNILRLDPLRILSSGSLLAAVKREYINEALDLLKREGIEASIIGEVVEKKDYLVKIVSEEKTQYVTNIYVEDPLIELFNKYYSGEVSL
ncbi:MAG: AIR synthase family protein [Sulfolobales archaeon]